MAELILGQVLRFEGNPMEDGPSAARHFPRGAVLVEGGHIRAVGEAEDLRRAHPAAEVTDCGSRLLSAGFVDAHAHYPQTAMIASWGKRLIDWLNSYTFPEEMRFADPAYAAGIAERYFDLLLAHGTTSVCSYCTIHPESVEAFFAEARTRGLRAWAGKTCMDRDTAPQGLRDTAQSAYDDSRRLLERWHGVDRLSYVITPRFAPTALRAPRHPRAAFGARRALGGEPLLPHADASERADRRDRLGEVALPRGARLSRHLRDARPPWPRGAFRPCDPPRTARARPVAGSGREPDPLPDLEHLHRLGALRHGRARARGPADRAGDRYRGWIVLLDAQDDGRGLRGCAAPPPGAAPGRALVACHPGLRSRATRRRQDR